MAELRVRTIDESELETVLAEDLEFEGTIEFADPLLVKGQLSGQVHAQSDLYIAASAVLDADIEAARVSVKGTVRGDITATERIELFSGASIEGNIVTPDLIVQSGSHFTGTCRMSVATGEKPKDPADKDKSGAAGISGKVLNGEEDADETNDESSRDEDASD